LVNATVELDPAINSLDSLAVEFEKFGWDACFG
jgi:hypothetical protein